MKANLCLEVAKPQLESDLLSSQMVTVSYLQVCTLQSQAPLLHVLQSLVSCSRVNMGISL